MPRKAQRTSRRRLAAIRLAEIYKLAYFRRAHGVRIDNGAFLWGIAATLAAIGPNSGHGRWAPSYGLDILSLKEGIRRADLGDEDAFDADELMRVIHGFDDQPKWISAERLGELLQVTIPERQECLITTIESCEETKEERETRQKRDRRERDRQRKRRARGSRPRTPASEPWKALGISRATYYRRNSQGETNCPRTIIDNRDADIQSHTVFPTVQPAAGDVEPSVTVGAGVPSAHWAAEGDSAPVSAEPILNPTTSVLTWSHPGKWSNDPLVNDPTLDAWADEVADMNRARAAYRVVPQSYGVAAE